ncbi:MAG: response regulator [Kiritimatiellia bacterium]|nr:response regulator [Kiritimatiellia bacterium]
MAPAVAGTTYMQRILVIEDEVDLVKALHMRLDNWGFEVIAALDAYEGTKLAMEENPDLIILDLMLPAGGGISTLRNIRNSLKIRFIPVIILTGIKDEETKRCVTELGVSAYIEKPYSDKDLKAAIEQCLHNSEQGG